MGLVRVNGEELTEFARRFSDPEMHRLGAEAAGDMHVELTQEIFENEGRPLAVWAPKQIPQRTKFNQNMPKRTFEPTPRLQSSGDLVNSINRRVTPSGYEIGPAELPYAAVHQFGAQIRVSKPMQRFLAMLGFFKKAGSFVVIPARPYIGMVPLWEPLIVRAYLEAKIPPTIAQTNR